MRSRGEPSKSLQALSSIIAVCATVGGLCAFAYATFETKEGVDLKTKMPFKFIFERFDRLEDKLDKLSEDLRSGRRNSR